MVVTRKRLAIAGLIIAAGFLVLWGIYTAAVHTTAGGRVFQFGLVGQAESVDPARVRNNVEKLMASTMYEPLVRWDDQTQSLKPCLANNWGYAKDAKSIIFALEADVKFHSGRRLNAHDVKMSWERSLRLSDSPVTRSLFSTVVGTEEFINGSAQEISGIKVLDAHTLQVNLTEPDSAFVYKVTHPAFWVVDTRDAIEIPPGTGPYKLDRFNAGEGLTVKAFRNYHGLRPAIAAVRFICYQDENQGLGAFKAGEIDALDSVPRSEVSALQADTDRHRLVKSPLMGFYAYAMNVNKAPYNQLNLRRAINYCIDRDLIIKNVMGGVGQPARGILPMAVPGYNRALQGYTLNTEKAIELLADTDYFKSVNPPVLQATYNTDEGHARVALALKNQLETMQIAVQPTSLSWEEYEKRMTSMQLDFFRLGWDADYPDADAFLYPLFHSSQIGVTNLTGYRNPQVDRILDAARAETQSNTERIKLLRRAEQIILDDAPMLWLVQKEMVSIIRPDVQGFKLDGLGLVNWSNLRFQEQHQQQGVEKVSGRTVPLTP
ncbi:MAG: ABC transporter substrate-binding protein [Syntrophomonadaceae bacterium]|nr:ABC transporter substrate-binding protein [Syntrophomonadaceae bacterium]